MFKTLSSFFVCLLIVVCVGAFASLDSSIKAEKKVYISSDQLVFSNYGIFVLLENTDGHLSKILIPQVNCNENGLFILNDYLPSPEAAWCRHGHRACDICYRCTVSGCPSNGCKCKR